MSTAKLQTALAKSLVQLKSRDQIISTLKNQLRATQTAELPTSTPPQSMKLDAAAIDAQNVIEEAKARATAAEARTAELQSEVHQLVEASKQGGEAHAEQLQTLQKEVKEAQKVAAECKDAKEMQDQVGRSLKAAVSEAMAEKEATFERLGEARELAAELQDALRSANSQIRMLRAEVAALHEQIDTCAPSEPATPAAVRSVEGADGEVAAEDEVGVIAGDDASPQQDVRELQALLRRTREEVGSVKMALAANHTPRSTVAAVTTVDAASSPTASAPANALEDDANTAQKLVQASEREASMEQRIAELEGQLEAVKKEQMENGAKGTELPKMATGASEEEMLKLNGELERLHAAEFQASEELARRIQELSVERQRAADAERALEESQEASKAEVEHLSTQLAELREQLVVGASDEALAGHLAEFVAARNSLFEVVDAQEAELETLRGQLESVLESPDAATALAHVQGTFTAMRTALGRRSSSIPGHTTADSAGGGDATLATGTGTVHTTQHTHTTASVAGGPNKDGSGENPDENPSAADGWGDGWDDWGGPGGGDNSTEVDDSRGEKSGDSAQETKATVHTVDNQGTEEDVTQLKKWLEEATTRAEAMTVLVDEAVENARVAEEARDEAIERARVAEAAQQNQGTTELEEAGRVEAGSAAAERGSTLTQLESKLEDLQKVLEACISERDSAQSALAMAEALSQKHEAEAYELQKALETAQENLAAELTARSAQVQESDTVLSDLRKLLEDAEKDRTSLQEALSQAEALIEQHNAAAEQLKKDLEASAAKQEEVQSAADSAAGDMESEVRKRAAATLKKTKALHEAQLAELRSEVESALKARHEDTLAAEQRVEAERQKADEAEAVAAARLQAVNDAEAKAQEQCAAAQDTVAEVKTACAAAEQARDAADSARVNAEEETQSAQQALAAAEASKESAIKEASARESRLKKAVAELRHKVDVATAEQCRAEASTAEARTRIEGLQSERATADACAQMLEKEVEKLQREAGEYRARAQALLAQKDKEIESAKMKGGAGEEKGVGVAEAIGMLSEMRAELAKKEADHAAAMVSLQDEKKAAEVCAENAAEEVAELQASLQAALARAAAADELRQRAADADARLAARSAASAADTAAAAAAPQAASLQAQLHAARAELAASQSEHDAYKDMASRMADAREEALNTALQQVADLKSELEQLRATGAIATPTTPALADTYSSHHPAGANNGVSRGGLLESANSSLLRRALGRSDSFELGEVLANKSAPGADTALHGFNASGPGSGHWTQSGDFGAFFGDKTKEIKELRERVAKLEADNRELVAESKLHEEQLVVLKEELRAIDRAEKRAATSGNAQVMEFLKANIISLYATGEAERLLEPFGQILSLSDNEKKQCKEGLARWKGLEHQDPTGGYLGALFGVR